MKLKDFIAASEYDVYICSTEQEKEKLRPDRAAYISNLLKGCPGIMEFTVKRFYVFPEQCAIFAAVSLPWEIMQSIYGYNRRFNIE